MITIKSFIMLNDLVHIDGRPNSIVYEKERKYLCISRNVEHMICASANFDISETIGVKADVIEEISVLTTYGIVDLNVVEVISNVAYGDEMEIIEFLPRDFRLLCEYDKTGAWISNALKYDNVAEFKNPDYEMGFEKLCEIDKTGEHLVHAGITWTVFDYKKAFKRLTKVDKSGSQILKAGMYWKHFPTRDGIIELSKREDGGRMIFIASNQWKSFDFKLAAKYLEDIDKTGIYVKLLGKIIP